MYKQFGLPVAITLLFAIFEFWRVDFIAALIVFAAALAVILTMAKLSANDEPCLLYTSDAADE